MPLTLPNLGREILGIHPFSSAWWTPIYPFTLSPVHYLEKIGQIFQNALGFPGGSVVKKQTKIHLPCRRLGFHPWVEKIPWRRKWQSTLVFLPGKSHGQRSLVGSSPWGSHSVGHDWTRMHSECINHLLFCQANTTGLFSLVTGTSVFCIIPVPRTNGYVLYA